ncbi:MAG: hypothetical protein ACK6DC_18605 [Planctomycetota bacterium]|jgi:hypothetical protein
MQRAIRFHRNCPTCGRPLHIPIDLYGKLVRCHGCNAEFRATGEETSRPMGQQAPQHNTLDFRVDSLLAAAERQLEEKMDRHCQDAGNGMRALRRGTINR